MKKDNELTEDIILSYGFKKDENISGNSIYISKGLIIEQWTNGIFTAIPGLNILKSEQDMLDEYLKRTQVELNKKTS